MEETGKAQTAKERLAIELSEIEGKLKT